MVAWWFLILMQVVLVTGCVTKRRFADVEAELAGCRAHSAELAQAVGTYEKIFQGTRVRVRAAEKAATGK